MAINAETATKLVAQYHDALSRQRAADARDDAASDAEYEACREELSMLIRLLTAIAPAAMHEIVREAGGDAGEAIAHVDSRAGNENDWILGYDLIALVDNKSFARDWFSKAPTATTFAV